MPFERTWTAQELDLLRELKADPSRFTYREIGQELGRPAGACKAMYEKLVYDARREAGVPLKAWGPSAAQLAERDARAAARLLRSTTQEFFGDPPPGFSAFDRKRQEAGA